jgi:indole-3-glycerol phosphate synthase
MASCSRKPHDFAVKFRASPQRIKIIAEVKLASPSNGVISTIDPVDAAGSYIENGATAISVLTEPEYFKGSVEYLTAIRTKFPDSLLLMKDFIIALEQLLQGRIAGADGVLLIVALLSSYQLEELYNKALELGLTPLIEVHNLAELEIALNLGAKFIGVNNRDLTTLKVSLDTSFELANQMPKEVLKVSESGINFASQINDLRNLNYDGFLIGSSFMKTTNPGAALKNLLLEVNHVN